MGEIQSCVESKLCHRKQTKRAVVTDDIKWGGACSSTIKMEDQYTLESQALGMTPS